MHCESTLNVFFSIAVAIQKYKLKENRPDYLTALRSIILRQRHRRLAMLQNYSYILRVDPT